MEEKCQIGSENLRNRDVVNEDRIFELHEALLLLILSSLPTETVVATSVFSNQWRSLWKIVPRLKFDSEHHRTFSADVYRSLLLHEAPDLESLHLIVRDNPDARDNGIWIGIAFACRLRRLVLRLYSEDNDFLEFPRGLCSWNDTLEILKLKYCIRLHFPTRVCLRSLRKLCLYYVDFFHEAFVCNLSGGAFNFTKYYLNNIKALIIILN